MKRVLFAIASMAVAAQKGKNQQFATTTQVTTTTQNQTQANQYQTQQGQSNQPSQQSQQGQYQAANQGQYQTQQGQQGQQGQYQSQQGQQGQQSPVHITGGGILSRTPTPAAAAALLDYTDAILLLLDHQTGLFQTVEDVELPTLRNNVVVLSKIAQLAGVPILTTASEPNGSNGPLMEELASANLTYIPRQGEVSAWDNAAFVNAVQASGKKTLIMAGVWTSVCVAFPALQALADGYKVYAVWDASGDASKLGSEVTLARLSAAGVIPVTTNVILCELQRTWNRPDANSWLNLYNALVPAYRAVGESYNRAQQAALGTAPTAASSAAPTPKARGL